MAFDYKKFLEKKGKSQTEYKELGKITDTKDKIFLNYKRTRVELGGGKTKDTYFSRALSV